MHCMSHEGFQLSERIVNISKAEDLFGQLSASKTKGALEVPLIGVETGDKVYLTRELVASKCHSGIYNFPFLINADGSPWYEANSYLIDIVANKHVFNRPADDARRRASRLLDYKIFTEQNAINWLDFSGRRLTSRPTYRYFQYLIEERGLSAQVVNQYTSDVYHFYQFVSENWHDISMKRVDSVKTIKIYFQTHSGARSVDRLKRSQTQSVPQTSKVQIGFVRDDGEVLRPLQSFELKKLKDIINSLKWSPIERLIMLFPIMTGARKQTVLTLRVKHIDLLISSGPNAHGYYVLHAGPGTQVDTKNNKHQALKLPEQLVKELYVYAHSSQAKARREKFKSRYEKDNPNLDKIADEDVYLFLSDQGNCYFMARDDPRYPMVKSPPRGQVVETLKRKILKVASNEFPKDFYYHWLRATFALLLWKGLEPKIQEGVLTSAEAISVIQERLYHKNRETTENYLKLFRNMDRRLENQELYEGLILPEKIFKEGVYFD